MDNWTKLGALYYLVEQGKEDKIEVKDFIKNNVWDGPKLCEVIDDSIVYHIIDNISPILLERADVAWWIPYPNGISPPNLPFNL